MAGDKTKQTDEERLVVDHNHKTGMIRGLLCHRCNTGLGHFEEKIDLLHNAIEYLRRGIHNE
jgi:hypothetical protein